MKQFFYAVGDERRGPISETSLLELFRLRGVSGPTLVWSEGMADWRPLAEVFPHWLTETAPVPGAVAPESDNAICVISGRFLPKAGMIRFGDVYVSPESRDVYLQRLQQGLPLGQDDFTPATIWQRFGARFIDNLIVVACIALPVVLAMVAGAYGGSSATVGHEDLEALVIFGGILVGGAGAIFYETAMTKTKGSTLGKLALGTQVVKMDGAPVGWGASLGRALMKIVLPNLFWPIDLVSIIMALADQPWRRALHDRVCGTRVVQRRR